MQARNENVSGGQVVRARARGNTGIPALMREQLTGQGEITPEQLEYLLALRKTAKIQLDVETKKRYMAKEQLDKHEKIDLFLSTINSEKTKSQYKKCILDYIDWYNENGALKDRQNILLSERQDALRYISHCKTYGEKHYLSESWFTGKIRALGSFFSFLESNHADYYFTNIFRNHKIKYKEYNGEGELFQKETILITKREIETIKKELLTMRQGKLYRLAFTFMAESGIRIGGLKGLSIKKDKRTGLYKFNTLSKNNPLYHGVISEKTVKAILREGLDLKQPFKTINYNTMRNAVNNAKKKYKMDFTSGCHALRHYHAVELYEKTKNILLVSRALNHKKITTTTTYLNHLGLDVKLGE
jgi:integrase